MSTNVISVRQLPFVAQLLVCCSTFVGTSDAAAGRAEAQPYSHLLFERRVNVEVNGKKSIQGEIAVVAIPQNGQSEESPAVRRLTSWDGGPTGGVLAIRDRTIFARSGRGEVHAIDLRTGRYIQSLGNYFEGFLPTSVPNHFIGIGPYGSPVYQINSTTEKRTVLVKGGGSRPAILGSARSRIALSPDGRQLATATYRSGDYTPKFDISVVDLTNNDTSARLVSNVAQGDLHMTGGGDAAVAPPIFWLDEVRLLTVNPLAKRDETIFVDGLNIEEANRSEEVANDGLVIVIDDNGNARTPTHVVRSINVDSGESTDVCKVNLPPFQNSPFGTAFWRRSDGAIMLRCMARDIRIDVQAKSAEPDRRLSPVYETRGDTYRPSLWYGDQQLSEKVFHADICVSPDGRCIAWLLPVNPAQKLAFGSTSSFEHVLLFHSADTGLVQLASGKFATATSWGRYANPNTNPCFHWIPTNDSDSDVNAH